MTKIAIFATTLALIGTSAFACAPRAHVRACDCAKPRVRKEKATGPHYRYYWQMPEELAKSTCEGQGGQWDTSIGICNTY